MKLGPGRSLDTGRGGGGLGASSVLCALFATVPRVPQGLISRTTLDLDAALNWVHTSPPPLPPSSRSEVFIWMQ